MKVHVSNVQSMIVYLRSEYDDKPPVYFLGLVPLTGGTADEIFQLLVNFIDRIGLGDDVREHQMIGFCSDGACTMIDQHRGVATLLQRKYKHLETFHCMAHRLELDINDAINDVSYVGHFQIFIGCLYKFFSMSPKKINASLSPWQKKCLFNRSRYKKWDDRWAFSSFIAMKAVLRDLPALLLFLQRCSADDGWGVKERSKYAGLCKKIELLKCVLKDGL